MTLKKRFNGFKLHVRKGDLVATLEKFASLLGYKCGMGSNSIDLDHSKELGGSLIILYNERCHKTYPFGSDRCTSTKEVYDKLCFGIASIEMLKQKTPQKAKTVGQTEFHEKNKG